MRKTSLLGRPSMILATLGGAAGVLFFGAAIAVGAAAGAPGPGLTEAVGGLWLGSIVVFVVGWLVLPLVVVVTWNALPGDAVSVPGALLKGALVGAVLWVVVGLLLPLLEAPGGLFGAGGGMAGALALLIASLGYGVIVGAVASMGRGMAPLETFGWEGHGAGRHG